jgi:RNA polymerase sigma-70 factor (ECF subfamily)
MSEPNAPPALFAKTHWSVVLAAGRDDSPEATEALEQLCRTYWYPLYAYLRRRGESEHDAQDLTQGFFAQLLRRRALRTVAPGRGRFRSFLLVALTRFLADEHDRQQAQKRGGGQQIVSIDAEEAERRYRVEPSTGETPETLYERRWAIALTERALARLGREFIASDNADLFGRLHGYLVKGAGDTPYAEAGAALGMSAEAVKKAVQRLRSRYREVIREEIAQTVATATEIDEELRYLYSILCR